MQWEHAYDYDGGMAPITLPAHFDGRQVLLDQPYPLRPDTPLLVTVLPADTPDAERQAWLAASQAALARAYGEGEPDYSDMILRESP